MAILPLVRLLLLAAGASALQLYTEEESFAVDPSAGAHATESASASPQKKTHKKHSNHSKSDVKKHHRKGKTQKTAEKEQGATNSAVKSVAHQKTSGGVVAAPTATQQKSSHSSKAVTTAEKSSHSSKAVTTVEKTSHSSKAATTAGKSSHSSKEVTTAEKKHSTVSNRTKKSKTGVHKKEAGNVTAPKQEASSKQDTSAAKTSSQQQGKDSIVQKVVKEKPATPVKTITAEATAPAGETTRHVPGASVVKHMSAAAQTATHGGLAAVGNLAHRAAQVVHSAKDGASKAIGAVAHGASMVKDGAAKAKNEAIGAVAHGASIVKDGATKAKTEAIGAVAHGASIVKDGAAKAKTEAIGAVAHGASMVADEAKQTAAGVRSSVSHIFQSPRVAADESHDNAGDDVEPSNATQVADAKRVENDASAEKADSEKATPVADSAANTTAGIDNATKPTSGVPTGDAPHAAREKVTAVAGDVKNATSVVTTSESTRGTNKVLEKGAQKQTPLVGAKKMIPHIPADQVPRIADEPEEAPHMEEEMDDIEVTKHEEHGGKSSLATTGAGSKLQEQIHGLKSHLHELIHEGQKKVAKKRAEYEKSLAEQHANTTEIRRTNKRLADEIEWISLQNTKLWERSRALRSHASAGWTLLLELHSSGLAALSGMHLHVQVYSVLTGGIICETLFHRDFSVAGLKRHLAANIKIPVVLQQLLCEDGTTLDENQTCGFYAGDILAVRLARLPLQRDGCTSCQLCNMISLLRGLGPGAVRAYAGDLVSLMHIPPDTKDLPKQHIHRIPRDYIHDWHAETTVSVQIAAIGALQILGDTISEYACDVATAWPTIIDEQAAVRTIDFYLRSYFRGGIAALLHPNSLPGKLCSLWSAMGIRGIAVLLDNFHDIFSSAGPGQRGLALAAVTHAALALPEAEEILHLNWFADFLRDPYVHVHICAVQCMCEVIDKMKVKPHLHAQYGYLLSMLTCPNQERAEKYSESLRGLACHLLGRCAPLSVSCRRGLVAAMLSLVSEVDAQNELGRFKSIVHWKSHGAYMWFMKRKSIVGFLSFACRGGCGTLSVILEEYRKLLSDAGPGQRAIVLLCAARSLPTCTKSAAVGFATWFASFLTDPRWELRACAIHCLQRVMAGSMAKHADQIASLLRDPEPFVRSSAATALGCLGGGAVRYKAELLSLLASTYGAVRYASLVTLGGLTLKLRPHRRRIADHLNDPDLKCRMAALRALKCMGLRAAPYKDILLKWESRWYGSKPEAITARALMFKNVPLKDLFKGHAPLGKKFGGSAVTCSQRRTALQEYMNTATRRDPYYGFGTYVDTSDCDNSDACADMPFSPLGFKEVRAQYRSVQKKYQAIAAARRQQELQERLVFKLQRLQRSDQGLPAAIRRSTRSSHGMREHAWKALAATDWVILPRNKSC